MWNTLNYLINIAYFHNIGFIHHSAQHEEMICNLKRGRGKNYFTVSMPEKPGTKLWPKFSLFQLYLMNHRGMELKIFTAWGLCKITSRNLFSVYKNYSNEGKLMHIHK
jgi:hypothetical protein